VRKTAAYDSTRLIESVAALNVLIGYFDRNYIDAGFHSGISGNKLKELHEKCEVLDSLLKQALDNYTTGISKDRNVMHEIADRLHNLLEKEKTLIDYAGESTDEGVIAIVAEYIKRQEELMSKYASIE
jgi:DNA-binding ferritin-like protein